MPEGGSTRDVERLRKHRRKMRRAGVRRVEVLATEEDARLIRDVAETLRSEGAESTRVRTGLQDLVRGRPTRTGADLLAFFRASPLLGQDIGIERDRSPGRTTDLA